MGIGKIGVNTHSLPKALGRLCRLPIAHENKAEISVRERVIGIDNERLAERGRCLGWRPLFFAGNAQVVMSIGIVGIN